MKRSLRINHWQIALLSLFLIVHLVTLAFAAEGADASSWRETYDLVMRWLNFFIFAAVIIKFGGKPIKSFIGQQREEVSIEIQLLEKEKREMEAKVDQTVKMGEESQKRLKNLKERILAEGQRRKKQIIEDAKNQGALMIEDAKRKAEHRILVARKDFRQKLIDAALEVALKKLPNAFTTEDQEKRLKTFLNTINAS